MSCCRAVLSLLLAANACGAPAMDVGSEGPEPGPMVSQAIIEARPLTSNEFPSAVALLAGALLPEPASFCSGTLIAPDVVLTAAHCLEGFRLEYQPRGGTLYVSPSADPEADFSELRTPLESVIHPDYTWGGNEVPDVALIFLSETMTEVPPAVLLTEDEAAAFIRPGQPIDIVGFGRSEPDGPRGKKRGARTAIEIVGDTMFAFGVDPESAGWTTKCSGDSGGPTYLADVGAAVRVIGVASKAQTGCASVSIDVRADAFRDFIDHELRSRCAAGTRAWCGVEGLPTASDFGAGTLPAAAPLPDAQQMPAQVDDDYRRAASNLANCLGLDEEWILMSWYGEAFALGVETCTADDHAVGEAFYDCYASASCESIQAETTCKAEWSSLSDALTICTMFPEPTTPASPPHGCTATPPGGAPVLLFAMWWRRRGRTRTHARALTRS